MPGTAHQAMLVVGVVEIVAGLVVAVRPKVGGYLVAAWLAGIITNLLLQADFYDIALRDLGLLIAALALARLATAFDRPPAEARQRDRTRPPVPGSAMTDHAGDRRRQPRRRQGRGGRP